jgi:hypothetical protein
MICWVIRILAETALDEGRTLSSRVQRHLRGCPACRDRVEQTALLAAALRTPRAARPPVSASLHARIMAGMEEGPAPHASRLHRLEWVAGLAVLLMAAVFLWRWPSGSTPDATPLPQRAAAGLSLPALDSVLTLIPAVYPATVDLTLKREMDALKNDLASAGFYLLSCAGVDG